MKIKKSDVAKTVRWVECHFARKDSFPMDSHDPKAAKHHLKAFKEWRQAAAKKEELKTWCETWLSDHYQDELVQYLEKARMIQTNKSLSLDNEALMLLLAHADNQDMTPSELVVELLQTQNASDTAHHTTTM